MNAKKWIVEFRVSENWVADGFDLTEEVAKAMIEECLPYAYAAETSAKIISSEDVMALDGAPEKMEERKNTGDPRYTLYKCDGPFPRLYDATVISRSDDLEELEEMQLDLESTTPYFRYLICEIDEAGTLYDTHSGEYF